MPARPGEVIRLDTPDIAVRINVLARATRFTLRLGPPGEGAILTVPPGVPMGDVRSFLSRHSAWLAKAVERRPETVRVAAGAQLPVAGHVLTVRPLPGPRAAPYVEGERLILPGAGAPAKRVATWLKERARAFFVQRAAAYAARIDRPVGAINIRDTRSRWGSCSTAGNLSFSWRLAMAPVEVADYVAAHEAAHLVEMNHSPRFWALVQDLCPDQATHRAWLKRKGASLHAYHFE